MLLILPQLFAIFILVFIRYISKREDQKIAFFHFMAHRFRSPISIIRWYMELLLDKSTGPLNPKQKEYLDEIYKSSEKLNETIESMFTVLLLEGNKISLKSEPTNVKNLIKEILQKLQFKIKRHNLHFEESYPTEDILLKTDPKLLGISLQYLLENVITYSPENGNINLALSSNNKKTISIEIKDQGYRASNKKNSLVLNNYINSTDAESSLYIVKSVLKKLHADFRIKSQKDKGTEFNISISS